MAKGAEFATNVYANFVCYAHLLFWQAGDVGNRALASAERACPFDSENPCLLTITMPRLPVFVPSGEVLIAVSREVLRGRPRVHRFAPDDLLGLSAQK